MLHWEFAPPEELRNAIQCFWYSRNDIGEELSSFEVVPDGYTEIIFYFGSTCSIERKDGLQLLPSPFMMGLLNQPVVFFAQNCLEIIAIRCFPWAVADLLGLHPGKNGVQVFEHPIAGLQPVLAQLVAVGKIEEAIIRVKQYFLNAKPAPFTDDTLSKAGRALKKANGTIPVSNVAEAAHTTVRTLERKFRQSSGHTVKDVAGLMRFEQIRNRLWHQPNSNLASLAAEFGYADQAHLSKEFKRYSGTSPAAFARKARTDKPFDDDDFVAFIQS